MQVLYSIAIKTAAYHRYASSARIAPTMISKCLSCLIIRQDDQVLYITYTPPQTKHRTCVGSFLVFSIVMMKLLFNDTLFRRIRQSSATAIILPADVVRRWAAAVAAVPRMLPRLAHRYAVASRCTRGSDNCLLG